MMHEQKNLFLAIGLSIAIIVAFQFLFPQQTMMSPQITTKVMKRYNLQPRLIKNNKLIIQ